MSEYFVRRTLQNAAGANLEISIHAPERTSDPDEWTCRFELRGLLIVSDVVWGGDGLGAVLRAIEVVRLLVEKADEIFLDHGADWRYFYPRLEPLLPNVHAQLELRRIVDEYVDEYYRAHGHRLR